ncbi:hypothetical protein [Methylobacterium sp. WL64]|nr:hypothetical protein [Methylobacterium sp. WL64]
MADSAMNPVIKVTNIIDPLLNAALANCWLMIADPMMRFSAPKFCAEAT